MLPLRIVEVGGRVDGGIMTLDLTGLPKAPACENFPWHCLCMACMKYSYRYNKVMNRAIVEYAEGLKRR